jgi:UDP-N-acetylmuramoylalanine--D-glutamate ligase
MENYVESKWKITSSQSENNLLILNVDDETILQTNLKTCAKIAHLSQKPVGWGIYTNGDEIIFKTADKEEVLMLTGELSLPGIHNRYNSMAAALAARVFEIKNEDIRDSLMKFSGVEHRLEFVRTLNGIDFINDSKATNINATWYALSSYKQPIVWIAGGRGDNNNYAELDQVVEKNVSLIIAIGEEAQNIFNHFCTKKRCLIEDDLRSAVVKAFENAEFGDKILFTPACKSFDMFDNFEQRGVVFKEIVNSL